MKKDLRRAIEKALEEFDLDSYTFADKVGHNSLTIVHRGRTKTFTVSNTPSENTLCAKEVARDVRRFIRGQYT